MAFFLYAWKRPKRFQFLSRFKGRGFLNLKGTDEKIKEAYENTRSIIEECDGSMEYNKPRQWTWEHCSFRCRYVFIPEFRGRPTEAELNYESLSNEEYCRLIRNEFAKLLTLIVNEMSVIEPRQAKTSANSRERTKTLSRPENRRERLESASEQKRHTGEGKAFYWGHVDSAEIFSASFENRHFFYHYENSVAMIRLTCLHSGSDQSRNPARHFL